MQVENGQNKCYGKIEQPTSGYQCIGKFMATALNTNNPTQNPSLIERYYDNDTCKEIPEKEVKTLSDLIGRTRTPEENKKSPLNWIKINNNQYYPIDYLTMFILCDGKINIEKLKALKIGIIRTKNQAYIHNQNKLIPIGKTVSCGILGKYIHIYGKNISLSLDSNQETLTITQTDSKKEVINFNRTRSELEDALDGGNKIESGPEAIQCIIQSIMEINLTNSEYLDRKIISTLKEKYHQKQESIDELKQYLIAMGKLIKDEKQKEDLTFILEMLEIEQNLVKIQDAIRLSHDGDPRKTKSYQLKIAFHDLWNNYANNQKTKSTIEELKQKINEFMKNYKISIKKTQ